MLLRPRPKASRGLIGFNGGGSGGGGGGGGGGAAIDKHVAEALIRLEHLMRMVINFEAVKIGP